MKERLWLPRDMSLVLTQCLYDRIVAEITFTLIGKDGLDKLVQWEDLYRYEISTFKNCELIIL